MSRLVSLPLDSYRAGLFGALPPGPFSLGAARGAMWLAQLAYEDDADKVAIVARRWQLEPLLVFDRASPGFPIAGNTRGLVARGPDATLVAFGGTDPLVFANWITDFRFVRNSAGVHRGFDAALDIMWPEIRQVLRGAAGRPLIFTGHSLGGALAVLCARRALAELGEEPDAVYCFGMPRAGDAAFASDTNSAFGERLYRLAHGSDIVPSLPPAALGFCHAGRYLHCASGKHFALGGLSATASPEPVNGTGLAQAALEQLRGFLRKPPPPAAPAWVALRAAQRLLPAAVADHLPPAYWRALMPG